MIQQPIIPGGQVADTQSAPEKQGEQPHSLDILFGNMEVPSITADGNEDQNTTAKNGSIDGFGKTVKDTDSTPGTAKARNEMMGSLNNSLPKSIPNSTVEALPEFKIPSGLPIQKAPIPSVLLNRPRSVGFTPSANPNQETLSIKQVVTGLLADLPTTIKLNVHDSVKRETTKTNENTAPSRVPTRTGARNPTPSTPPTTAVESSKRNSQELILQGKIVSQSSSKLSLQGQNSLEDVNNPIDPLGSRPMSREEETQRSDRKPIINQGKNPPSKASVRNQTVKSTQPPSAEQGRESEPTPKNFSPDKVIFPKNYQSQVGNTTPNNPSNIKVEMTPSTLSSKSESTVISPTEELTQVVKKVVNQAEVIVSQTKVGDSVKKMLLANVAQVSRTEVPRVAMLNAIMKALEFIKQPVQVRPNVVIDTGQWGLMDIELQKIAGQNQIHIFVDSEKVQGALQTVTPIIAENLLAKGIDLSAVEVHVKKYSQQPSFNKQRRKRPRRAWQLKIHSTENVDLESTFPLSRYYGYNTIEILA